jgi:hypothetical protein
MRKVIMVAIAIMIAGIVAGSIFYACKKEEVTAKQDNVKIHKFDPNLHGIDIEDLAEQPCFNTYADICAEFVENIPDFTAEEIAMFEELLRLLQEALELGDYDLAQMYADSIMNLYYKTTNPTIGREKLDVFRNECEIHISTIGDYYPEFAALSDYEKGEVLEACFESKYRKAPLGLTCKQACAYDYKQTTDAATVWLSVGLLACTFTTVGAGILLLLPMVFQWELLKLHTTDVWGDVKQCFFFTIIKFYNL